MRAAKQAASKASAARGGLAALALLAAGVAAQAQTAPVSVERLTLFASLGGQQAAHTAEGAAQTALNLNALGIAATWQRQSAPQGGTAWTWELVNTSGQPIRGLRLTALADADMEAAQNTFFNETARQPTGPGTPAGQIRADRWEAAEPGYHTGDLLARAATGQLGNQSALSASAPDDAALALSLPVPEWQPGQRLSVTATLTPAAVADASLLQTDAASGQRPELEL